jgi:putative DNA methylase
MSSIKAPKKLIEVALPLDAINKESSQRKRKAPAGYPTTLHKWWAQRPMAAARAVLFAQMVNDPGYERYLQRGLNKEEATKERERLFGIIERLVLWENTNNEEVLEEAREEIRKSWRETCELNKNHAQAGEIFNQEKLPVFQDPFAGSGAIPLEAQRLGMASYASDLNPVAVIINKAMIEIPPRFIGHSPVGPRPRGETQPLIAESWPRASGLAEDVRRYGTWMRVEAEKRIGHLYPKIEITAEMAKERLELKPLVGKQLTIVAWLWARTVKSPNPAFSQCDTPLVSTFVLSSKAGKEVYVTPIVSGDDCRFEVKVGNPPENAKKGTKAGKKGGFFCVFSKTSPIDFPYIRDEATAGRMSARLMAIVADSPLGRIYLSPSEEQERVANSAQPDWKPEFDTHGKCRVNVGLYGLTTWDKLYTNRQLVALDTLSQLVQGAIEQCRMDALAVGMLDDPRGLAGPSNGATAYAQAIGLYLAFAVSRAADYGSSAATWRPKDNAMRSSMPKQAVQMTWDYAEGSPFAKSSSGYSECINVVAKVIESSLGSGKGVAEQKNAVSGESALGSKLALVSTDPPYYDNISYADLSDFFYVWLRRSLRPVFPDLFATVAVPKAEELVASPYRQNQEESAETFFLNGMTSAIHKLTNQTHPAFPVTIYYAFKQSETDDELGTTSAGWETFLEAVLRSGFSITGTWPMRTEGDNRQVGIDSNALASSIVLVCRKRTANAISISRRDFIRELNAALPEALLEMTGGGGHSSVAPVDLSQAIIGPGMAIFSKYSAVLESDGKPMSVRTALQLINRFLAEDDFDHETQFCLRWFEGCGWTDGKYGEADVLARAKGTSVSGLNDSGVVESGGGKVRLRRWAELDRNWSPERDNRTPIWEALHQMIRALNQDGESAAGDLLAGMPMRAEPIRALAYRLYTLCERKGWAEDARSYNELIGAWCAIERAANESGRLFTQSEMF